MAGSNALTQTVNTMVSLADAEAPFASRAVQGFVYFAAGENWEDDIEDLVPVRGYCNLFLNRLGSDGYRSETDFEVAGELAFKLDLNSSNDMDAINDAVVALKKEWEKTDNYSSGGIHPYRVQITFQQTHQQRNIVIYSVLTAHRVPSNSDCL